MIIYSTAQRWNHFLVVAYVENDSVPIQLTQCRFPGLAISTAKILMQFSSKIYGIKFIKQHSETVMV